jgi:hypothetical protein
VSSSSPLQSPKQTFIRRDGDVRNPGVLRVAGDRLDSRRYMDTPFLQAVFQIVPGVGILIGAA